MVANKLVLPAVVTLAIIASPLKSEESLRLAGDYFVVGRAPDQGKPYAGTANIKESILGTKLLEWFEDGSTATLLRSRDEPVDRIRFTGSVPSARVLECQASGLTDSVTLTCFWWYADQPRPAKPGIEVLIPIDAWPTRSEGAPIR